MSDWLAKFDKAVNDRLDRVDEYIQELQQPGEPK